MIAARIRAMGAAHWLALFGLILGAWVALFLMAVPEGLRDSARVFGSDFWAGLCVVTPDAAGFLRGLAMWALMSAAMMAPTALPAFATYDDLGHSTQTRFGALIAGYLVVWLGFSALASAGQLLLLKADLVSIFGDSRSLWLSAGLLVLAGAYQFSALKEACLSQCRAPLTFFMSHWDEGAFRNGLRLGAVCLGCCWALMLLAFVGGMTSLAFMGLATALMILEKLRAGAIITRPLGAILIAAGVGLALMS